MDDTALKMEVDRRIEKRATWSREETTKGLTALSILAAGAIIVSINSLKVLHEINGCLQWPLLLVLSWICLIVTEIFVICYRLAQGKWLLEAANNLLQRRYESAPDGNKQDRIERACNHDRKERAIRWVIYLSFAGGFVLLLIFAASNLLTSGPVRLTQSTPTSMPI